MRPILSITRVKYASSTNGEYRAANIDCCLTVCYWPKKPRLKYGLKMIEEKKGIENEKVS